MLLQFSSIQLWNYFLTLCSFGRWFCKRGHTAMSVRAQSLFHLGPHVLFPLASQQGMIILDGPTPVAAYSSEDLHFFHFPHSVFDLIKAGNIDAVNQCQASPDNVIDGCTNGGYTRNMMTSQWIKNLCCAMGHRGSQFADDDHSQYSIYIGLYI